MMKLYDSGFCNDLVYGGWDSGIINNLKDAREEIKKNFEDMDFENANAHEEMREIVDEMLSEIDKLINNIESVQFV